MSGRSRLPSSLAAAVLEALVAAVFIDSGDIDEARRFVLEHMDRHITEAAESEHQRNYKSQLQQYAQKVLNGTPIYELLDEQGPDHSKCFEVCVVIHGRRFPSAWGPAKKEAEQKAAYNVLRELNLIRDPHKHEAADSLSDTGEYEALPHEAPTS
jgi:ribonuclease III